MHEVTCFKHRVCSALLSLGDSSDIHSGLWSKRLEEGFSGPGSRLGVLKVLIGSVTQVSIETVIKTGVVVVKLLILSSSIII